MLDSFGARYFELTVNHLKGEKLVEIVEKYVKKGSKLHIEGKLETRNTARTEATGAAGILPRWFSIR